MNRYKVQWKVYNGLIMPLCVDINAMTAKMKCDDFANFLLSIEYDEAVAHTVKNNKIDGSLVFSYLDNDEFLDGLLGTTSQLQRAKFRCLFKRQLLQKNVPMGDKSIEEVVEFCKSIPLLKESAEVHLLY